MRFPRQNGINIHFLEHRAFVIEFFSRKSFEFRGQLLDRLAPVGLHYANHHIFTTAVAAKGFAQHVVSLSNPGRVPEKQFEHATFIFGQCLFQPLLRTLGHRAYCR